MPRCCMAIEAIAWYASRLPELIRVGRQEMGDSFVPRPFLSSGQDFELELRIRLGFEDRWELALRRRDEWRAPAVRMRNVRSLCRTHGV